MTSPAALDALRRDLLAALPASQVHADPAARAAAAGDKWHASHLPGLVAEATGTEQVSTVLRLAHRHRVAVTARGAGVGYVGGAVPTHGGLVLALAGMNRILELNPLDAVAVVQPGVLTGDLADAARALGWYYPPDPASLRECSIGGNIATNAGGPRCLKYGVTKHYVLGLTVVLMDGTVVRTGARTHKNKTGFDLTSLFVGSEGLLGVITEAILRLIPHPAARGMVTATFPSFETAAAAVQALFQAGHLPSAVEITDGFTLAAARRRLGPERLPDGNAHLIVETDGRPAAVAAELDELEALLRGHDAHHLQRAATPEACEAVWQLRREFSYSLRDTGLTKLNEDVVVPRGKLVELARFARRLQDETGIPVATFGHAGDGNLHVNLMVTDYADPATRAKADGALDRLFRWIIAQGGSITGEHGIGLAKQRWFAAAVGPKALALHRRLKAALDPENLLNPGKVWEE